MADDRTRVTHGLVVLVVAEVEAAAGELRLTAAAR